MITGSSLGHRQALFFGTRIWQKPHTDATRRSGQTSAHGPDSRPLPRRTTGVSTIRRVGCLVRGDLRFVAIAHRQQHVLREVQVAALFAVIFENVRLDDRIDGAAFFTETAENAFAQIDVVTPLAARV